MIDNRSAGYQPVTNPPHRVSVSWRLAPAGRRDSASSPLRYRVRGRGYTASLLRGRQLETAFRRGERIDGKLPGFAMDFQLKAIFEQGSQHEEYLVATCLAIGLALD